MVATIPAMLNPKLNLLKTSSNMEFDRVTGVTNPFGAFTYAYVNTTSRLSSVTYPSGTGLSISYSYFNNAGDQRLQTIQNSKTSQRRN